MFVGPFGPCQKREIENLSISICVHKLDGAKKVDICIILGTYY